MVLLLVGVETLGAMVGGVETPPIICSRLNTWYSRQQQLLPPPVSQVFMQQPRRTRSESPTPSSIVRHGGTTQRRCMSGMPTNSPIFERAGLWAFEPMRHEHTAFRRRGKRPTPVGRSTAVVPHNSGTHARKKCTAPVRTTCVSHAPTLPHHESPKTHRERALCPRARTSGDVLHVFFRK